MKLIKKISTLVVSVLSIALLLPITIHGEETIATSDYELNGEAPLCKGSNLAELTTDAMQWYAKSNNVYKKSAFSLVGEHVITGSLPKGEITSSDIDKVIADAKMIEVEFEGGDIYRLLEASVSNSPDKDEFFIYPSNLSYVIDPLQPGIPEDRRHSETFSKILGVKLDNNKPLEWIESYRVVLDLDTFNHYKDIFTEYKMIVEESDAVSIREIVKSYLSEETRGVVLDLYKNPTGDGRIKVITDSLVSYDEDSKTFSYTLSKDIHEGKETYWIAVPEEVLPKKLKGIIGNRLYRGRFVATIDEEEIECAETRYNVIVPISKKENTFSLKYSEVIGNTTNLIIMVGMLVFLVITGALFIGSQRLKAKKASKIYK